jgi:hypothetical protein
MGKNHRVTWERLARAIEHDTTNALPAANRPYLAAATHFGACGELCAQAVGSNDANTPRPCPHEPIRTL